MRKLMMLSLLPVDPVKPITNKIVDAIPGNATTRHSLGAYAKACSQLLTVRILLQWCSP